MHFTEPLRNNFEFKRLYYKGKSAGSRNIVVYCMKTRRGVNRLGLTVGVKTGNAVTRNRIRRRIKESYRLMEGELVSGFDIVIAARASAADATYQAIDRDIRSALRRLGLFKSPVQ